MKKADAIAAFGSVAALAEVLRVSVQAIYKWPDEVPELRRYQIRALLAERAAQQQATTAAQEPADAQPQSHPYLRRVPYRADRRGAGGDRAPPAITSGVCRSPSADRRGPSRRS